MKKDESSRTSGVDVTTRCFRAGDIASRHSHPEGQFAYAATGSMSMFTDNGNWIVPAQRAIWVPSNVGHEMRMHGTVTVVNSFVSSASAFTACLPSHCQVFGVSTLLRQLFDAMLDLREGQNARRASLEATLLNELSYMPQLALSVPLPRDPRLLRACKQMIELPNQALSIDQMASLANVSRRTFTRQFKSDTGMSFVAWRKQLCILEALSRLSRGASVKDVSVDLGYSSTSAFSAVFKELLGEAPVRYLSQNGDLALETRVPAFSSNVRSDLPSEVTEADAAVDEHC